MEIETLVAALPVGDMGAVGIVLVVLVVLMKLGVIRMGSLSTETPKTINETLEVAATSYAQRHGGASNAIRSAIYGALNDLDDRDIGERVVCVGPGDEQYFKTELSEGHFTDSKGRVIDIEKWNVECTDVVARSHPDRMVQ